jgi:ribosomal protein S18 acetylase RimI-like enzyme
MDKLTFSYAHHTETKAVAALINSAYRGDVSRLGWTTEANLLEGRRIDEAGILHLLNKPDSLIVLAKQEHNLLGSMHLQAVGQKVELSMFAVNPQQQGSGIGKKLLQHAEQTALETWQIQHFTMSVISCRQELIAFYQRRGYQLTGELKDFPVNSALWMQKVEQLELAVMEKNLI